MKLQLPRYFAVAGLLLTSGSAAGQETSYPASCAALTPARLESVSPAAQGPARDLRSATRALVRATVANANEASPNALDATSTDTLQHWLRLDSVAVFTALAEMIADESQSSEREAILASQIYHLLDGPDGILFAVERERFGFGRRADVLDAISAPLETKYEPVVKGFACDAYVLLSAIKKDSTYWGARHGYPGRITLEFVLRRSYLLLDRVTRRQFDTSILRLLGDQGRQLIENAEPH